MLSDMNEVDVGVRKVLSRKLKMSCVLCRDSLIQIRGVDSREFGSTQCDHDLGRTLRAMP